METGTKNILKMAGFRKEIEAVENGFCPICKEPVVKEDFRDELSKKEYRQSGMCMKCQDMIFGGGHGD